MLKKINDKPETGVLLRWEGAVAGGVILEILPEKWRYDLLISKDGESIIHWSSDKMPTSVNKMIRNALHVLSLGDVMNPTTRPWYNDVQFVNWLNSRIGDLRMVPVYVTPESLRTAHFYKELCQSGDAMQMDIFHEYVPQEIAV
jgi:hypothetical protein